MKFKDFLKALEKKGNGRFFFENGGKVRVRKDAHAYPLCPLQFVFDDSLSYCTRAVKAGLHHQTVSNIISASDNFGNPNTRKALLKAVGLLESRV